MTNADLLISSVLNEDLRVNNIDGVGHTSDYDVAQPQTTRKKKKVRGEHRDMGDLGVHYGGYIVRMKPKDFLALNAPYGREADDYQIRNLKFKNKEGRTVGGRVIRDVTGTDAGFKKAIKGGLEVTAPSLKVEWNDKGKHWNVIGHEGRHRMTMAHELWPDKEVDVHIYPYLRRAKHMTDEHLFAPIVPDRERVERVPNSGGFYFAPDRVVHQQQFKTRPAGMTVTVPKPLKPRPKPRKKKVNPFVTTATSQPPKERAPRTPEEQEQIDRIMKLIGL